MLPTLGIWGAVLYYFGDTFHYMLKNGMLKDNGRYWKYTPYPQMHIWGIIGLIGGIGNV